MTGEASVYCVVPLRLWHEVGPALERTYAANPEVEVIADRRRRDRRAAARRGDPSGSVRSNAAGVRRVTNPYGRRVAERRRAAPPTLFGMPLPREARRHAERIVFVDGLVPVDRELVDVATARCITRVQMGDEYARERLYGFWFDRLYRFFGIVAGARQHDVERTVQDAFLRIFDALPGYDFTEAFRTWLARVLLPLYGAGTSTWDWRGPDTERAGRRAERGDVADTLGLLPDGDLVALLRLLQPPQRHVVALHYVLGLTFAEIAALLGRPPADVATANDGALRFVGSCIASLPRRPGLT